MSMLQQVINYEFHAIQHKGKSEGEMKLDRREGDCLREWKLTAKLNKIKNNHLYQVRMIGYEANSHLLGVFYCLALSCFQKNSRNHQLPLKLKYQLYCLCEEFLTPTDQKIFVESLCLLQYSKDLLKFLSKSSYFLNLVTLLFASYLQKTNSSSRQVKHFHQIQSLFNLFQFPSLQIPFEDILKVSILKTTFYLIKESSIWFMLTPKAPPTLIKANLPLQHTSKPKKLGSISQPRFPSSFECISSQVPVSPQTNDPDTPKFLLQKTPHKPVKKEKGESKTFEKLKTLSVKEEEIVVSVDESENLMSERTMEENRSFASKSVFPFNFQTLSPTKNIRSGHIFQSLSPKNQKAMGILNSHKERIPQFLVDRSERGKK